MNNADALVNGSLSAYHCGSVCPCGLSSGRSLTVAYSARDKARCDGSDEKRRSGLSCNGIIEVSLSVFASPRNASRYRSSCQVSAASRGGSRNRQRRAIAIKRDELVGDLGRETDVAGKVVTEDGTQREQAT